ncbi:MAG: PEP-CTERM sorting domain-containing protein [Planctomycetales bacterium]|nr:PEP-CTERM sorting domain-containing protein [Planctomycetales bacterium]
MMYSTFLRILAIACAVFLGQAAPVRAAFVLQENFDDVSDWTNHSGGALSVTTDPADAGNSVGTNAAGSTRNSRSITAIANDTIGTIFFRFRLPAGAQDFGFGFGDAPANNQLPVTVFASGTSPTDLFMYPFSSSQASLASDVWYSLWLVVDNRDATPDEYTGYLQGGAFTSQTLLATKNFSNTTGFGTSVLNGPIDTVQFREFNASLLIDDLYIDATGENLANPTLLAAVPEPSTLSLLALAQFGLALRRRSASGRRSARTCLARRQFVN